MAKESERPKLQEKEDHISGLPDPLLQHILSLLPSTKEAIQTTVLSKRWHNQWTHVLILNFHSSGISAEKLCKFIDDTLLLHNCSKIKKFHIQSEGYYAKRDSHISSNLDFAIRKEMEELILNFRYGYVEFSLPEFLFNYGSLVKLHTNSCNFVFMPYGKVSWEHLKSLNIENCRLPPKAIENILGGTPSLESLELAFNIPYEEDIIASKSLKKLVLNNVWIYVLQISCPNVEELTLCDRFLALTEPKLMNCPSLVCATLDFEFNGICRSLHEIMILQQLEHVNELKFGRRFIKILPDLMLKADLSSLRLKNKSLTLDSPNFATQSAEIELALGISYVLEKLVVKLPIYKLELERTKDPDLNVSTKTYWNSKRRVLNCLVSHLKRIEIIGLSRNDDNCKLVLSFVEFLLKNATVLEKLVVILKDGGKDFAIKVSQKLFNSPKCSGHAVVELLCYSELGRQKEVIDLTTMCNPFVI
ncbi:F-box/LRR-repeat protein At5g02910-like [Euphorbia lathyris]|uniref:F-box/LRR-repeat protein At5g02910-like n=1 Tax=Euphorbia lathyris TaxID=212925 RepID=UPI0033133B77